MKELIERIKERMSEVGPGYTMAIAAKPHEWQELIDAVENAESEKMELAILVRRLIYRCRKYKAQDEVANQAFGFLDRKGLLGSPLRDEG